MYGKPEQEMSDPAIMAIHDKASPVISGRRHVGGMCVRYSTELLSHFEVKTKLFY
jgi:hypothetical protein